MPSIEIMFGRCRFMTRSDLLQCPLNERESVIPEDAYVPMDVMLVSITETVALGMFHVLVQDTACFHGPLSDDVCLINRMRWMTDYGRI